MQRYNKIAIGFHWIVALIMIGLLALGLIMVDMPKPDKYVFYGWHKAFGIIVLGLVTLRLIWRIMRKPPELPQNTLKMHKIAAHVTHIVLYVLMFAMPLIGWTMSSAGGHPVSVFGLKIPAIVGKDKELGSLMHDLHEWGSWALIAVIMLHLGASLYHHFILKDGILLRMLPGKESS
ncbi:MAG: cytochrome b [Rickettsiales bacterium]|nr:cytochrome b [Rickettsiales bacterium]